MYLIVLGRCAECGDEVEDGAGEAGICPACTRELNEIARSKKPGNRRTKKEVTHEEGS